MDKMKKGLTIMILVFITTTLTGFSTLTKFSKRINKKVRELRILSSTLISEDLEECSGVEISKDKLFWMINDSHNTNELFLVNTNGIVEKKIELDGVVNNDWEDLSCDESGNLFIGDFGNNDNDRNNLAIYIVNGPDEIEGNVVTPEVIRFSLEDQFFFPPEDEQLFFDIESFFVWEKQIYLFTKDRSEPFVGITNLYVLPATPGYYKAKYIKSFYTKSSFYEGAITSADISSDGSKVALLSNKNIWLFSDYNNDDFLSGKSTCLKLNERHQYEGIVFKNDSTFYLTNELNIEGESQIQEIRF